MGSVNQQGGHAAESARSDQRPHTAKDRCVFGCCEQVERLLNPEMLRRAAEACRSIQMQAESSAQNTTWFDWVPKHLDHLADQFDGSRPAREAP